jgi:tetratricopeptide (TPR) repeat protein
MNMVKEALAEVNEALRLKNDDSRALVLKGILLSMMEQDYRAALSHFDRAIDVDEGNSQAWTNRGIVLRKIGDNDGAVLSFQKALAIDPEDSTARQMLAHMGRQDLAKVIRVDKKTPLDLEEVEVVEKADKDAEDDGLSWDDNGAGSKSEVVAPPSGRVDESEDLELSCPRCGRVFNVKVTGKTSFKCPGCGLQGEVD